MLFFSTNTGAVIEWHVGEKVPAIFQPNRKKEFWPNGEEKEFPDVNFVVEVQACGDELEHILANFRNLPRKDRPVVGKSCRWFGDMARFIHANL